MDIAELTADEHAKGWWSIGSATLSLCEFSLARAGREGLFSPAFDAGLPLGVAVAQPYNSLNDSYDGGDTRPEENAVEDATCGLACVEVAYAKITEKDVQEGSHSLVGIVYILGNQRLDILFGWERHICQLHDVGIVDRGLFYPFSHLSACRGGGCDIGGRYLGNGKRNGHGHCEEEGECFLHLS